MSLWHLGNTTIRSPFRLKDGLLVLANSSLVGNLEGKLNQSAFAHLLDGQGIVKLKRKNSDVSDLGRKWQAALSQLGFIIPKTKKPISQESIGLPFTITESGNRLLKAESEPEMQECFLRALAAYCIPSPLEQRYKFAPFSPLKHTLSIMLGLKQSSGESRLSPIEMALIVQVSTANDNVTDIINKILKFRIQRSKAASKRQFNKLMEQAIINELSAYKKYKASTLYDYADLNFRYLKATGLIKSDGRGISLVPAKHIFIERLVNEIQVPNDSRDYLKRLIKGAALPIDNKDSANVVYTDLIDQLQKKGISFDLRGRKIETQIEVANICHDLEALLSRYNEEEYAAVQAAKWEEIVAYMELLSNNRSSDIFPDGSEIFIPKSDSAAYFEWIIWRAFLAINSLKNKPYEARRFKVYPDYLPIGVAPGNGPDMWFEFEDFVLVVEVTLTVSSRQEAAEGEPVRRHVAEKVVQYHPGKPVYGLFVAKQININTIETFRTGSWYHSDDQRLHLSILPMTLEQFKDFFKALFATQKVEVNVIHDLILACDNFRDTDAFLWKNKIEVTIKEKIAALYS